MNLIKSESFCIFRQFIYQICFNQKFPGKKTYILPSLVHVAKRIAENIKRSGYENELELKSKYKRRFKYGS